MAIKSMACQCNGRRMMHASLHCVSAHEEGTRKSVDRQVEVIRGGIANDKAGKCTGKNLCVAICVRERV